MRKISIVAIVTSLLLVVGYGATWQYYSVEFRKHIETELADIHQRGYEVSFDYAHVKGFPFGFDVHVKNLSIKKEAIFHTWVEGEAIFSSKLWKPQEISLSTDGKHVIEMDEFRLNGDGLLVRSFLFDPMRINFSYDVLDIQSKEHMILKCREMDVDLDLTPKDASNAASLKIRLAHLGYPALKDHPLGENLESIDLESTLTGDIHGDTLSHKARNWYEEDGVLDVNNISLGWGPISFSGNGSIVLDESLQPLAAFSLRILNLNEGIDAMVEAKKMEKRMSYLLKAAAGLLKDSEAHKVSLSVQNKTLYIASIPIMKIPEIQW